MSGEEDSGRTPLASSPRFRVSSSVAADIKRQIAGVGDAITSEMSKEANVAGAGKLQSGDNMRDRMAATGNMAVIAALMAGFAFSSLSTDIPNDAEHHTVVVHFLAASSVTTGLSLILLFQQTIEYNFCMRELSAFGSDASFELCTMMRWQRRAGEVCFVLAIPSFAYSAGSMIFLKTVGTTFEKVGLYCGCVLALASISIIVILLTMERLKKAAHKKLKLSTLTAKQTFAGHFLAHKKLNAKHEDAPAGSTQLGLHVRKDRNAGSNGPLAGSEQAKALGANPRSELPEPEVRLATLKTMLDKDLITKVEFEAQRKAIIASV
jgi:hypothetical protein